MQYFINYQTIGNSRLRKMTFAHIMRLICLLLFPIIQLVHIEWL